MGEGGRVDVCVRYSEEEGIEFSVHLSIMKHPCQLIKRCCVSHWATAKPYLSGVLT